MSNLPATQGLSRTGSFDEDLILIDRRQLKGLIRDMGESLIVIGHDACISFVNKSTLKLLDYETDEIVGAPLGRFIADDNLDFFRALRDLITKGPIRDFRLDYLSKENIRVPVSVNGSALRDDSGGFLGIIIVARDMRDVLGLIRELEDSKHGLEGKVKARTKELEAAYSELGRAQAELLRKEKLASIGQLAAGLAHEINNPTAFILGNIGTFESYVTDIFALLKKYGEAASVLSGADAAIRLEEAEELKKKFDIDFIVKDMADLIGETRYGVERIMGIISDIRAFSHIDSMEVAYADINDALENTIRLAENGISPGAIVSKDLGDIPKVKCNCGELNQAFMNMLVNAIQAIGDHGEVKVRTWRDGLNIFIEIKDTGCGISDDHIQRIFDPFFTTKDVGKGKGLGLSIAYSIIKRHSGEIFVESKAGGGTAFTISLPVEDI
ncbi:MAG: PAS domain-containing protein [Deltaproteobacteria bacterium]|nr:PAS domain-containing protein [Deltaproteobacteria bacterium]